jgi:hypothetical protein
MIHIEECPLRALEQDAPAALPNAMQKLNRIRGIGRKFSPEFGIRTVHCLEV